eukprot:TRINITY_DN2378_c0_g1_i4.p1 TRINITY_DN2378_c0_g1~~TRINITY_DN2378_c0_g1_i4.p1  ORF type:complete len:320 (+),score=64.85 TRINITY_DN2378_c0_g1_i4:375-1334(+)
MSRYTATPDELNAWVSGLFAFQRDTLSELQKRSNTALAVDAQSTKLYYLCQAAEKEANFSQKVDAFSQKIETEAEIPEKIGEHFTEDDIAHMAVQYLRTVKAARKVQACRISVQHQRLDETVKEIQKEIQIDQEGIAKRAEEKKNKTPGIEGNGRKTKRHESDDDDGALPKAKRRKLLETVDNENIEPQDNIAEVDGTTTAGPSLEIRGPNEADVIARLVGTGLNYSMRHNTITIGRRILHADDYIDLTTFPRSNVISRRHAQIKYNPDTKAFTLETFGRNGTRLNGVFIDNDKGVGLANRDEIRLGAVRMRFYIVRSQ